MLYNYVYGQQPSYLMENATLTLCQSTLHTCGILTVMTSECARISDFSPHVIFALA